MSTNVPNTTEEQEIDFTHISKKIGALLDNFSTYLFRCIHFFVKNARIILILFIMGVGLGVYLDYSNKIYKSEVTVAPNFGSTDYLYSKIDLLSAKFRERDTLFLKALGIKQADKITKITIEPVVDVYNFINNSEQNFELLKLMAEDGDLKAIVKETTTSKNYDFHTITFVTKGKANSKITIQPILNYLNSSEYYKQVQQVSVQNIRNKIKINDGIVGQIDGILSAVSESATGKNQKSNSLVYYNENTQLNDVIKTKELLIKENGILKVSLLSSNKIVKDISAVLNMESSGFINGKLKLILPLLFIFLFIAIRLFTAFYKKQYLKAELRAS
jgi:hypothetical protein